MSIDTASSPIHRTTHTHRGMASVLAKMKHPAGILFTGGRMDVGIGNEVAGIIYCRKALEAASGECLRQSYGILHAVGVIMNQFLAHGCGNEQMATRCHDACEFPRRFHVALWIDGIAVATQPDMLYDVQTTQ